MNIYVLDPNKKDEPKKVDAPKAKEEKKTPQMGFDFETFLEGIASGMEFRLPDLDGMNPMEARFVTRKHKNKTKTVFIEPKIYDMHYPVKGYFNLEKSTTVLVFSDGSKIKTVSESSSRSKAHTGVLISLAKRILGPQSETDRNSVGAIYGKFGSDAQAEAAFYGVVLSYFVSNGLVKDPATFDMWLAEFVTRHLVLMTGKKE